MQIPLSSYIYLLPLFAILGTYLWRRSLSHGQLSRQREEARQAGLTEAPTLHPKVDPTRCIGCASCASACVQGALGVLHGKSELINPTGCMGLAFCRDACPVDAITLVYGSEIRGMEIPVVGQDLQTNVPGMFIAGELGGVGLIRNAISQGTRAVEAIGKLPGIGGGEQLDLIVVGAGPGGLAASLKAKQLKLDYLTIEQDSLGGTVYQYPRGKLVMTEPVELPLVGSVKFRETNKEELLEFWREIANRMELRLSFDERVDVIASDGDGFTVKTPRGSYRSRAVLLTMGRRGTPRKLGVPGEDSAKVVYRLIDPEQYRGQHVLVVGGGDSALEAAACLAEEAGTTVALSYRGEAFGRAKPKNRERVTRLEAEGRLRLLMRSNVKRILPDSVHLDSGGEMIELPNDGVIVNAGGILPTQFLKRVGIQVETKYGTA